MLNLYIYIYVFQKVDHSGSIVLSTVFQQENAHGVTFDMLGYTLIVSKGWRSKKESQEGSETCFLDGKRKNSD